MENMIPGEWETYLLFPWAEYRFVWRCYRGSNVAMDPNFYIIERRWKI